MLRYILGSTNIKVIIFKLESEYGITIVLDYGTELRYSVGSSKWSNYRKLDDSLNGISLGLEDVNVLGSSDGAPNGSADGIKFGIGYGADMGSSVASHERSK